MDAKSNSLMKLLRELQEGNAIGMIAQGASMWPVIPAGSKVFIEPVNSGDVRRGDIIAWTRNKELRIHRVVSIDGPRASRTFVTKGDYNAGRDSMIEARQVVGIVRMDTRGARMLSQLSPWIARWYRFYRKTPIWRALHRYEDR